MEEYLNEREINTDYNKCPNCSAQMTYDIETTDLKCAHCGHTFDFDESGGVGRRAMTDDIIKSHENWKEGAVFRCDSCGAKGVLDSKSMSTHCAFCGSPHIVSTKELAGIKPDSVIPFQITKQTARTRFIAWLRSKWFIPNKIKHLDTDELFNAVYSSSWAFSSDTNTKYQGVLGRRETQTRTVNGRLQTTTVTKYFRVQGEIQQNYRDFFVQSGEKIKAETFNKLKPFNLSFIKAYRQEYLAGTVAEHYSRTIDVCFKDFTDFIKRDLRAKIMRRHNADVVQTLTLDTVHSDKSFNYVLLPIYIASYIYNKKLYNFHVNGTNGKVVGKYPISKWKIFFTVLGAAVIAGGAFLAYTLLS